MFVYMTVAQDKKNSPHHLLIVLSGFLNKKITEFLPSSLKGEALVLSVPVVVRCRKYEYALLFYIIIT